MNLLLSRIWGNNLGITSFKDIKFINKLANSGLFKNQCLCVSLPICQTSTFSSCVNAERHQSRAAFNVILLNYSIFPTPGKWSGIPSHGAAMSEHNRAEGTRGWLVGITRDHLPLEPSDHVLTEPPNITVNMLILTDNDSWRNTQFLSE